MANIEAGLVSLLEQGVLAPQPISPLAVLLMGLSNQAVAAIAGASDPVRARRDIGAAVRHLLDGLQQLNLAGKPRQARTRARTAAATP
ncbi:hypothetical protein [Mycobacterium sp. 852013-50091_SCH5140682]|uniref:hypothetical protein n=1 Tax=Mycobacterium sp. 852013-50091_SCH5140682 TaxID=1834109 RepID=UPI00336BF619